MIRNERKVISNSNRERGRGKEKCSAGCENRTRIGLAENEVTRRGNSSGIGSEEKKIQRRVERKGRGLEEKSRQIFVPAQYERRRVAKKNRRIKRNSSGDSGGILFETNATRETLSSNLMISMFVVSTLHFFGNVYE